MDVNYLNQLPNELLLEIFQYVDTETICENLYNVCTRFRMILNDKLFWKKRFNDIYGEKNHMTRFLCGKDDKVDLRELFYESTCRENRWSNMSVKCRTWSVHNTHSTDIDSIHLMRSSHGRLVVTGSRDHRITLFGMSSDGGTYFKKQVQKSGHKSWVWSVTSVGNDIFTGSWDRSVKIWTPEGGDLVNKGHVTNDQAVLSLTAQENLLAVGLWSGASDQVKLFDVRDTVNNIHHYALHRRAVLDLKIYQNYIVSVSEDKTIGIYDFRAQKMGVRKVATPLKVCCGDNVIYVGDSLGFINVINPMLFQRVERISVAKQNITGIHYEPGMLATVSVDQHVRITRPCSLPINYAEFIPAVGLPVSMDFYNEILAVGSSNGSVQVWMPDDHQFIHDNDQP